MRTRLACVMSLLLACITSPAIAAPATAEAREAAIRAYIEELAGPTRFPTLPIKIELTFEMASSRSAEEANAIMAKYADRPDHPERAEWERHARLHAEPFREQNTILVMSDDTWSLDGIMKPSLQVRMGERSGLRWMLADTGPSEGMLTITQAGVPFSAGSNIWQMRTEYLRRFRKLSNGGLPESTVTIRNITPTTPEWRATIETAAWTNLLELDGDWVEGAPRVTQWTSSTFRDGGTVSVTSGYLWLHYEGDNTLASTATQLRSDDVSERVRTVSVSEVPADEVREAATLPEPPEGLMVMDYRKGASRPFAEDGQTMLVFEAGRQSRRVDDPRAEPEPVARPREAKATEGSAAALAEQEGGGAVPMLGIVVVGAALVAGVVGVGWLLTRRTG